MPPPTFENIAFGPPKFQPNLYMMYKSLLILAPPTLKTFRRPWDRGVAKGDRLGGGVSKICPNFQKVPEFDNDRTKRGNFPLPHLRIALKDAPVVFLIDLSVDCQRNPI